MNVLAGADFFTVEVLTWRGLVTYYCCSSFIWKAVESACRASLDARITSGWSKSSAAPRKGELGISGWTPLCAA